MKQERIVSRTLMGGIVVSGTLMLVGFLLYAFQPSYHADDVPMASWEWMRSVASGGTGAFLSNPFIFLYAGILALMTTPIIRIIITAWTFWCEGDTRYVWISLIVLVVIGISITFSIVH
ncbi:DUF1634 domain-containing protein [bacterium]|nr:DUF1634 domain-containing protein [bacterium]